jgi:uncharacterized protein
MPHTRNRHVTELILKKLKFTPAVAIQGARQTGKSFIGREILPGAMPDAHYLSLDEKALRTASQNSPDDFLKRYPQAQPLIIDEAQKSPDLFDALKLSIDLNRIPGRYILLGSTEFSKLTKIRESLTGRMSRVRVFPFNLAESLSLPLNPTKDPHLFNKTPRIKREDLHLYLERGGLPGMFSIRSDLEREQALTDLLDLILFRDARYVSGFDPELGREILEQIARLQTPSLAEIASTLRQDGRRIKRHLEVLKELFVVHSLEPSRLGFGKDLYFIYDCALAKFLGADFPRLIQTWFLNEQLSQRTSLGELKWKIHFYSTQKGSRIDFLIESNDALCAIKIFDEPRIRKTETLILKSLLKKADRPIRLVGVGPFLESYEEDGIEVYPFEAIA